MKFCPRCATPLEMKADGGRERPTCPAEGCRFVHFGHSSIGCGAVLILDQKALLIQRGINPNRGGHCLASQVNRAESGALEAPHWDVI